MTMRILGELFRFIGFFAGLAKLYIPAHYLKWLILAIPALIGSIIGQIFSRLLDLSKWLIWLFVRFFFWLGREVISLAWLLLGVGLYISIGITIMLEHTDEIPSPIWAVAIVWPLITVAWNHIVHLIQDDVPI